MPTWLAEDCRYLSPSEGCSPTGRRWTTADKELSPAAGVNPVANPNVPNTATQVTGRILKEGR